MTALVEAAGDVATGAAWSRMAEPLAGEHAGGHIHGLCLNCSAGLTGRYCHACGQSSHVPRTLMSIVHDLLHGVFHFEGKIWRTVPMLVLHPGQLTRRYIDGERAKFVSPLAMFLFTVFLMFAVFSATGPGDLSATVVDVMSSGTRNVQRSHQATLAQLARFDRERAALVASGKPTAVVDGRIASLRADAAAMEQVGNGLTGKPVSTASATGWTWLKHAVSAAQHNPGLIAYKVQSATYKFSWALIFLSTPFVAMLFLRRRQFGLYDHATFVTYSISFMSVLVIVLQLLLTVSAPKWLFTFLANAVPPVHMFAQLRGAYSLSIFSALWRTVVLAICAVLVLIAFVISVVLVEITH